MGSSVSVGLEDISEAVQETTKLLQDKPKIRELWMRADENKNGYISLTEFKTLLDEADAEDSTMFVDFDNDEAIRR